MDSLASLVASRRVLVCIGTGGVGKTTISAALGLAAAQQGRRALVLTVDPARRLANALGLAALDEHVRRIDVAAFAAEGCEVTAPLDAAMLDVKRMFDRVVERHSPSEAVRDRILAHPFYRQASTALAGSQEYMAMERLFEAATSGEHDLVVLDTPPAEHALEFLESPSRLVDLFDSAAFRMLVAKTGSRGRSSAFRPGSLVMRGLSRFTSGEMFGNLLEFFSDMSATFDGFVERARQVRALLHGPDTAFVIVAACDRGSAAEAIALRRQLSTEGYSVGALVLNRAAPYGDLGPDVAPVIEAARSLLRREASQQQERTRSLATAWATSAHQLSRIAAQDAAVVASTRAAFGVAARVAMVPRLADEPDSLRKLADVARFLAATGPL